MYCEKKNLDIMMETYRDIMDALANIGNLVRATEFIGQSSGLTLILYFVFFM